MKKVILFAMPMIAKVGLSANPTAKTVESAEGINGKVNIAKDGAHYIGVTLEDHSNPLKYVRRHVNYRQQKNSAGKWTWRGANPQQFAKLQGSKVNGTVVTRTVQPYDVQGREVDSYTTIVLAGENEATVFRNAGHEIVSQAQATEAPPVLMPDANAFTV